MLFFENALLGDVDFVDGLGGRVVDLAGDGGLPDAPPLLVDQPHQLLALVVRHLRVSLGHRFRDCFLVLATTNFLIVLIDYTKSVKPQGYFWKLNLIKSQRSKI